LPWFVVSRQWIVQAFGQQLLVLDRASGKRCWQREVEEATWFSPTVADGMVLAAEAVVPGYRGRYDGSAHVRAVCAFAAVDGALRWRNENVHPLRDIQDPKSGPQRARAELKPLSVADGLVLIHISSYQFRQGGRIAVLDLRDGRELWHRDYQPGQLYDNASQRFVLRGGEAVLMDGLGVHRFDARTGQPIGEHIRVRAGRLARPNGACTASRATIDWLMCNAWLYVGPDNKPWANFGARGACGAGVVPANGMVFVLPTACDCGDYTRGYQGLAPALPGQHVPDDNRLHHEVSAAPAADASVAESREETAAHKDAVASGGWPTFLGTPQRNSVADAPLPAKLAVAWKTSVAAVARDDAVDADRRQSERYLGALSAPVVADGTLLVTAPEKHTVFALDASTGKPRWSFLAGGKVDSPPTLAGGLAVFGCGDGHVYALRASDGKLQWRFAAATTDGVGMWHGHLASAFPLPGATLVLGDTVLAVAGHHTDLGGLHFWALDLASGQPRAQRVIQADQRAVASNCITVADADGQGFWIGRQIHLSLALTDLPAKDLSPPLFFDRWGPVLRFRTERGRGGSTHGWGGAMSAGPLRGHRLAYDGTMAFALVDPTDGGRVGTHPLLTAGSGTWRERRINWTATVADLGGKPSYGALVKAGPRLYLGGGQRDGSAGFLQVVDAESGKLLAEYPLPARVTECGLAAAGGRLYVSLENGELVCFATEQ
jgi:outer membrane protein assembly factor BamB